MGLDYIPEYVSPEVKQKILEMTEESEPSPGTLPVIEYLIRHWCETVEDGNPLYLDEEYTRSMGFRGLVAPPGMISTFGGPFRWPWPPKGHRAGRGGHQELKEMLNLPVGIATDVELEFYKPIQVGDRLSSSGKLSSISPWKKTRLGEGHFWSFDTIIRNQEGEVVARQRMTFFGYGREESPAK